MLAQKSAPRSSTTVPARVQLRRTTSPHRYAVVEWTFVEGGLNNNADVTYINNVGAALNLQYTGASTSGSIGAD